MLKFDKIKWETIDYYEERDTDGSVLEVDCVQQAKYKNGYLVRNILSNMEGTKKIMGLTFILTNEEK